MSPPAPFFTMDKNTIAGLLLVGAIFLGWTWYSGSKQKDAQRQKQAADSVYRAQHPGTEADTAFKTARAVVDTAAVQRAAATADSIMAGHLGSSLVAAKTGAEEFTTLENDRIKVTFSNFGGRVAAVELKEEAYKSYDGGQVRLFDAEYARFDTRFFIKNPYGDSQVNTSQYYFRAERTGDNTLAMRLHVDSASYVEYLYTLTPDDYTVGFQINFVGMAGLLSNQGDLGIEWENSGNQNEKGFENENNYSDLTYMYPGTDDMEKLGLSKGEKQETVSTKVRWVAFKQQFFSSILLAEDNFTGADLRYDTYKAGSGRVKHYTAKLTVPFDAQKTSYGFSYYFGPNKYSQLRTYGEGFQKLVPLGWGIFGWVNRWIVIPVFDFLSKYISSFGLIILLLTIFIKIIISPLTYKSYLSTARMRLLKPEIDEINAKFPNQADMAKKQQATMELYKRAGVNPMGGCIPLLIQFPILIAMFRFFPSAIELRGQAFLWADDLSSYDSIFNFPPGFSIPFYGDHVSLFALLMAVSMYFVSRISSAQMTAGPQMAGMKFMTLYLMPVMMLFWFNNYSSGLSYYYMLSNFITLGQTWAFRYFIDDKKLHAQMKANAKKPRKKSKWTEKYEQMLKEQQRQTAANAKKRK